MRSSPFQTQGVLRSRARVHSSRAGVCVLVSGTDRPAADRAFVGNAIDLPADRVAGVSATRAQLADAWAAAQSPIRVGCRPTHRNSYGFTHSGPGQLRQRPRNVSRGLPSRSSAESPESCNVAVRCRPRMSARVAASGLAWWGVYGVEYERVRDQSAPHQVVASPSVGWRRDRAGGNRGRRQ